MGTTGQSITLANSIIGVGILAMPFCFQQCGVLLASIILLFMGLVSRLCCYFLLKSALIARRRNFEFLALHVFGSAGKMAVEIGIIGFLMCTSIAYFVVVGDLGPQIIAKLFNINQSDILRTSIMVIVSLVCVLPLGLLRNVDSLGNVSAATIGFYFCLVMKVIAEATTHLFTGDWHRRVEMWKPSGMLQCVPIFSMALFCQTQLFEIFDNQSNLSLEKMNLVTKNAINICAAVYFTLGLFGYIAFNSQDISGNVLMSLSPTMASDVIKLGFVMSVAFSFPLIIFPCRASIYSFLYKKVHSSHHDHIINHSIPTATFRCITVGIIAVSLSISLLLPTIELVLGLAGSTIGVLICVVFPAACFIKLTFKNTNERVLAKGVVVLGLIILVLGTYANLQAAETQMEKYDDKYITQERIDKIVEDFFEKREKTEQLYKQVEEVDSVPENKEDKDKDSEVQPPNPVPPQSNENNIKVENKESPKNDELMKEILLPEAVKEAEAADKVSETHPRNLKTKLNEAKIANGQDNVKENAEESSKDTKPLVNEEKSDAVKQQQLIETIKQHGEEQKELMKEQKEILYEIIKTKKELQQNKDEAKSDVAKKIAVESIKQIADMAIKSIGGVTEKPAVGQNKNEKKSERLEQLTNEAVQEIAKKAAETIEAIQEIKKKPELKSDEKVGLPIVLKPKPVEENMIQTVQKDVDNPLPIPAQNDFVGNQNIISSKKKNNTNAEQTVPKLQPAPATKVLNANPVKTDNKVNNEEETHNVRNDNEKVLTEQKLNAQNAINNNLAQNIQVENNDQKKELSVALPNPHSHSPDEPQSYKQGEDAQNKNAKPNNIVKHLPIPIALNNLKSKKNALPKAESNDAKKVKDNQYDAEKQGDNIVNSGSVRQKREVVDCTEMNLAPAERKICEALKRSDLKEASKSQDILFPVNFEEDALMKNINLENNMIMAHHIGRSLKSLQDEESDKKR